MTAAESQIVAALWIAMQGVLFVLCVGGFGSVYGVAHLWGCSSVLVEVAGLNTTTLPCSILGLPHTCASTLLSYTTCYTLMNDVMGD